MLRDLAHQLATAHATESTAGLPPAEHDADAAWSDLAESGLLALRERGPDGCAQATAVEPALVLEQLAFHLCLAPYAGQGVLVPELLAAAGATAEAAALAAGEWRCAPALDPSLTRLARPDDDG